MDEKIIVLKPGVEIQHKKKKYKFGSKKPSIPESVVIEILSAKIKTTEKKELDKALKKWREKYELTDKGADVDQNASAERDTVGA